MSKQRGQRASSFRLKAYVVLIILAAIWAYSVAFALNIHDGAFRLWLVVLSIAMICIEISASTMYSNDESSKHPILKFMGGLILTVPTVVFLGILIGNFFNGPLTKATDYAELITIEEKSFEESFHKINTSQIPLMDRDTAQRLGNRRLGSMDKLVSQFVPSDAYTQINVGEKPYRVTPLEYAGFFRWLNNKDQGIPNYLQVDMVTGDVEVKDVKENIKYSTSEYFGRDVKRHLRKKYPTTIFQYPSFEVDDKGHPYYIATTYEHEFFFRQAEPTGVIILDAVTGKTKKYNLDDTPTWIDRVYSADLIISQLDYNGLYKSGYLNSKFDKQGVTTTTNGYNYLSIDDDVYLYTGVTSVNNDASNIGFYLVNMRTKAAEYYPVTSADENSAMKSAEGVVQQMGYQSTFPILINLNDRPYYLSSMKDDSGLVRSYALVDAQNYQDVIIEPTIDKVLTALNNGETTTETTPENTGKPTDPVAAEEIETEEDLKAISGDVENISQAVVSGNTVYYFMIDGTVYKADISLHDQLPFVEPGTTIEGDINTKNEFKSIELKP